MNKTLQGVVKQNLKNILLTNSGERIMDSDFGVGLKKFLFEQNTLGTYETIKAKILEQVKRYLPFIEIKNINFFPDKSNDNILYILIEYLITPLSILDSLELKA